MSAYIYRASELESRMTVLRDNLRNNASVEVSSASQRAAVRTWLRVQFDKTDRDRDGHLDKHEVERRGGAFKNPWLKNPWHLKIRVWPCCAKFDQIWSNLGFPIGIPYRESL